MKPAPMKPAPMKTAKKRSIGITTLLSAIIAGLVLLSAGLVLALSTQTAWRNTSELLNAQTELAMTLIEEEIRGHVNPALEISRYLHNQVAPVSRLNPAGAGYSRSLLSGNPFYNPRVAGYSRHPPYCHSRSLLSGNPFYNPRGQAIPTTLPAIPAVF